MKKKSFAAILLFLGTILVDAGSQTDEGAAGYLAEASQFVQAAQEAEKDSYAEALATAQAIESPNDKARTLADIGAEFAKGRTKIGPAEKKILREMIREMHNETK